jgi:hypothetical protein
MSNKKPLETVGRNAADAITILILVIIFLLIGLLVGAFGATMSPRQATVTSTAGKPMATGKPMVVMASITNQPPLFRVTISFTTAHGVTLAWDPSPDSTVIGYKVYYGVASRTYTNLVTVGNVTNMNVFGLVEGTTYYFAVTAYNILGMESDYSSEVSYTEPAGPPIALLMSTNVATPRGKWTVLTTNMPGNTLTTNLPYPSLLLTMMGRTNRLTLTETNL